MNKKRKSWVQAYKQVEEKSNTLFDIFCQSELSRKSLEEQYGIPMLNEDYRFLESMRTDRKVSCERKVDTKYHIAEAAKRKQREKYEKQQKSDSLPFSSMSTEHMQLSETESSQELEHLQSSTAESEMENDDIRQKYKKVKYVHQASVCKPHTIHDLKQETFMILTIHLSCLSSFTYTSQKKELEMRFTGQWLNCLVMDFLTEKCRLPLKLLEIHRLVQSGSYPENWTKITTIQKAMKWRMGQNLTQIHFQLTKICRKC